MKKELIICLSCLAAAPVFAQTQPEQPTGQNALYDEINNAVVITAKLPSTAYDPEYYIFETLDHISCVTIERHIPGTAWPSAAPLATLTEGLEPGGDFRYVDTDVIPDSKYEYRILCHVDGVKGFAAYANVYTGVTPGALTAFKATVAGPEATSITLTATAPTESLSGAPLTSLSAIDIQRYQDFTYTTVHTFSDVEPGATYSWTLENLEPGHTYYFRAMARKGEAGYGEASEAQAYVGLDIPGSPLGVVATVVSENENSISWCAPESGQRGGAYDPEATSYIVSRRYLDGQVVEAGRTLPGQLQFTDLHGLPEETWTEYLVEAVNETGACYTPAESAPIVFGAPCILPFAESFSYGNFNHLGWTRQSSQDDPYYTYTAWISMGSANAYHWATDSYVKVDPQDFDEGLGCCRFYSYSPDGQTEGLVSPRITIGDAKKLKLTFHYHDFDLESCGNSVTASYRTEGGEWSEIFRSEPEEDMEPAWRKVETEFEVAQARSTIQLRIEAIRGGIPIVDMFVDNILLEEAGNSGNGCIPSIESADKIEYYTIDGRPLQTPTGICIEISNNSTRKIIRR